MSTTNQTLSKADSVLEVIFNHDREVPTCTHSFSEIMDEIIAMWRNDDNLYQKKLERLKFANQTLPTTANIAPKEHS